MVQYSDCPPALKDFLVYMQVILGKSEATVHEYYLDLRTFLRYLKCSQGRADLANISSVTISDITPEDLQTVNLSFIYEYMYYITTVRKNAGNSRARKASSIKSFFKYLTTKSGILKGNPAKDLDAPKIPDLLPKYLTLDESVKLLNSIESQFFERDYLIITLFLNCGLRLSELVSINLSNIQDSSFTVIGKGNRERTIYLNEACSDALMKYLAVRPHDGVIDRDALFLSKRKTRISTKMVQVIVKKSLQNAGLDTTKYSTHKLRHTAATLMYKHGNVDVRALQEILGHRQLSTTQIYTHVDNSQLRDAINKNPLSKIKNEDK